MNIRKSSAAVRGLAGAALGAYLAAGLWGGVLAFLGEYQIETSLTILGPLLFCPAAYLGYWAFRGLRNRRFGYGAAWGCACLALPLTVKPDTAAGWLSVCLLGALLAFFSRFLGRERFLRYVDPAWYKDPRRVCAKGSGGRVPNRCGPEAGFGLLMPDSFAVNEGGGGAVLYIRGTALRWEPPLSKGRTFSVTDVAGVIVGPNRNALYDSKGETLAWFRTAQKNGPLLARYLRDRGVPFYSLGQVPKTGPLPSFREPEPQAPTPLGEAVSECAEEPARKEAEPPPRHTDLSRHFSRDIHLQLRRTKPVGVWIAVGMALGLAVFFVGFPVIVLGGGPCEDGKLRVMMALFFLFMAGPWVQAVLAGELFPPRLSVENGHIWLDKGLFPIREIPLEDLGHLGWCQSDECYILFDKNGRILAKFSTRDEFGPQFLNFLTDHDIKISR